MISVFRKHQQWLMILITFMVIISFIWFYNRTNLNEKGTPDVAARVYDRNVTKHEAERSSRRLGLSMQLGMFDIMQHLVGFDRQHAVENLIVLRHEAEALGVSPTDAQVAAKLKGLPAFQTSGVFDPQKYEAYLNEALPPNGFTEVDLEELVRDDLRLLQVKALIDSTVVVAPAEAREGYELENQKAQLAVVRFKRAEFAAAAQAPEEEVKKRFDTQKDNLKSEEQRRIKLVEFSMTDEEKKLEGKAKVPVLEKLKTKAEQFAQEMTAKDAKFDEVAKKIGATVKETPLFSRSQPDAAVAKAPALVAEVFRRTTADPNTDPVRNGDAIDVLQLVEIAPSRPLTLDEAKPKLVEQIKNERADEAMNAKVAEARKKIDAEMKAGKPFAEAAKAAGVTAETLPPFSQAEPAKEAPDAMELLFKSLSMTAGQVSEFVPSAEGGALIFLEKRLPIDESAFEKEKPKLIDLLLNEYRAMAFQEWLRARREAAKFQYTTAVR